MKNIIKYALIITMCLFSVAFSSCSNGNKENDNGGGLHDFAKGYEDLGGGLVLGLKNEHEESEYGVIFMDKISDTLNVQFANLTDRSSEFIMKIFYEYEEVSFKINGGDILLNGYVFTAKSGESMIIPIILDDSLTFNNSHLLTVAVLTAPNVHAVDLDLMTHSYGMSITFELTNRNGTRQIDDKPTAQEPQAFLQIRFHGLMLNLDFEAKDDTQVFYPPLEIKAKSGETVKLAYRVRGYENTDDVLFIVLVDWQQQTLDGSKPFMHITNNPEYVSYGVIEITAPLEKGRYEITGFAVSNPFELRNAENAWSNDTCYRFTLIVE